MSICPFCQADLSQIDLKTGECPACGRRLPSDEPSRPRSAEGDSAPEEELPQDGEGDTADEERVDQTLEAGGMPVTPPGEEETGTADDAGTDKTLPGGEQPTPPPSEDEMETAEDARSDKTIPGGVRPTPPPTEDEMGAASDRDLAETLDSDQLTPEAAKRLRSVWGDDIDSDANPNATFKGKLHAEVAESKLIIQSRVLRPPRREQPARADYELIELIGEGGMGKVFSARQASIDRTVAVKMLKQVGAAQKQQQRAAFLAEAVVTGDLEHPNIVPIYDLGLSEQGELFYSMKRVRGTAWSQAIRRKSAQQNVDVLMNVADAIAFAHSRNVIHRDLKPENVMLGDFGEVLLMDWGLALSLADMGGSVKGGTPAYMAPEMADGDALRIGLRSDVYLLGAILFEIVTGKPPHPGKNIWQCLAAASKNKIRSTKESGELLDIAMRAMATAPKDRYATVGDFQAAIRDYLSHSESISLAERAKEDLAEAEQSKDYDAYSRALFGYREAFDLWEGNTQAGAGVSQATLAYAGSALSKGDYDLGASLLDIDNPEHAELHRKIKSAARERESRRRRLQTFKRVFAGSVVTLLVVVTGFSFWIWVERNDAQLARDDAIDKQEYAEAQKRIADEKTEQARRDRDYAQTQEKIAEKKTEEAQTERDNAQAQEKIAQQKTKEAQQERDKADTQRKIAEDAKKKEEYGAYIARIGLAAAKIDENAFDRARDVLNECRPKDPKKDDDLRNWEWRRLWHLCTQEEWEVNAGQPIDGVAFSANGSRFATGGWGGTAIVWDTQTGEEVAPITTGAEDVFAVAFSPKDRHLATGTNGQPEYVTIWDIATQQRVGSLSGHENSVLSVAYAKDGQRLLTSSYDGTARLWDLDSGKELRVFRGHEWWVWSADFSDDQQWIVTAGQDGSVIVWSVDSDERKPAFLGHTGPVYSAVFSPDGRYVASAGHDRRVLIWEPEKVKEYDYDALRYQQPSPSPADQAEYRPVQLTGHTAAVRSVRFSEDGNRIVSGGNDNTVRLWDTASGRLLKVLRGHGGRVVCCRLHPDFSAGEPLVLSGSHDHTARIWDVSGYEEVRVFPRGLVLDGHKDAVLGAAFSGGGERIVSASRDRTAKTWNVSTGRETIHFEEGHQFLASRAIFFPDKKRLLTAAVDNTARIWDVATGTELTSLEGTGPNAAVALSPDGKLILTGSNEKTAIIWKQSEDPHQGTKTADWIAVQTLQGHNSEITAVAVSPDGKYLLTGDAVGVCFLWDAQTYRRKWTWKGHTRDITAAVFLPDSQRVLTASTDNTVAQWDVKTGQEPRNLILGHEAAVTAMAVSSDGKHVLTASLDRPVMVFPADAKQGADEKDMVRQSFATVRLWEVETAKEMGSLKIGNEIVSSVAFSPDGRRAVTTNSDVTGPFADGRLQITANPRDTVRLWDLQTFQEITVNGAPFLNLEQEDGLAWSAIFMARDGAGAAGRKDKYCVLTVGGNDARLWDGETGEKLMEFSPPDAVASAHFSPDGTRIVTASWDQTARIWNSQTGRSELRLEGAHQGLVDYAVFSPDGTRVLTASEDHTAVLWDARTGKMLGRFTGHGDRVRSAVFSSDGEFVLTASDDMTARIWYADRWDADKWDADKPQCKLVLKGHGQAVFSAAFSADGKLVITGSEDSHAKLWDAATGKEVSLTDGQLGLQGHSAGVTSVAFSPDGERAITGSRDGTAKIWELRNGEELLTLRGHTDEVTTVAFSPDPEGRNVLTGSLDGTLILHLTSQPADQDAAGGPTTQKIGEPVPVPMQ